MRVDFSRAQRKALILASATPPDRLRAHWRDGNNQTLSRVVDFNPPEGAATVKVRRLADGDDEITYRGAMTAQCTLSAAEFVALAPLWESLTEGLNRNGHYFAELSREPTLGETFRVNGVVQNARPPPWFLQTLVDLADEAGATKSAIIIQALHEFFDRRRPGWQWLAIDDLAAPK